MLFSRRHPRSHLKKVREAIWPSMGLSRLFLYYKHRIARLQGTPYYIASGFATGVAISFTPFIGFHIMTAAVITWLLGGSMVAMLLASVISGNPWTFPAIWYGTYKLGRLLLHEKVLDSPRTLHTQFTFSDLLAKPWDLLIPMTLGSIPPAIVAWFISYYLIKRVVERNRNARLTRIHGKSKS